MAAQLPMWNLESTLPSRNAAAANDAQRQLVSDIDAVLVTFRECGIGAGPPLACSAENLAVFEKIIRLSSELAQAKRLLVLYWAGRCWADGQDEDAAARYAHLQQEVVAVPGLLDNLKAWVTRFPLQELADKSKTAADLLYWISRAHEDSKHLLSPAEEDLLAQLRPSGAASWQRLRTDLISHLTAELDGETVPFTALRKHGSDPSDARRRSAHLAGQQALASIEIPVGACLNAIRLESRAMAVRRGWSDPLAVALNANGIDEEILDLVHGAVEYLLPTMWRFAESKASLLGREKLPFWDIAAPLPGEKPLLWEQAIELVESACSQFSPEFAQLVRDADQGRWIDAAERTGKRQTALCMPMRDGQSRILVNFDGSVDSVLSLAHEIGHAYHYRLLWDGPELLRIPPLALAETASIFSESLLLKNASGRSVVERMALLNADLIGHFQVIVDTYSRYLFESKLTKRHGTGAVPAAAVNDLLAEAQEVAYGPSVDPATLDHRKWITTPHFYDTAPFTNWPYYFGLLLSLGLFGSGDTGDPELRRRFVYLLAHSGSASPVTLAKDCGMDLRSANFWLDSAARLERRVDEFAAMAAAVRAESDARA